MIIDNHIQVTNTSTRTYCVANVERIPSNVKILNALIKDAAPLETREFPIHISPRHAFKIGECKVCVHGPVGCNFYSLYTGYLAPRECTLAPGIKGVPSKILDVAAYLHGKVTAYQREPVELFLDGKVQTSKTYIVRTIGRHIKFIDRGPKAGHLRKWRVVDSISERDSYYGHLNSVSIYDF